MIDSRLEHELVDDVALVQRLLDNAGLGARIVRALDPDDGDNLPVVLYSLTGDDGPAAVNGPGLWNVILQVWAWGESDGQVWALAKDVHRTIARWDIPGEGVLPGVASVERSETLQKFRDVWDTKTPTRLLRESDAIYRLLLRVV